MFDAFFKCIDKHFVAPWTYLRGPGGLGLNTPLNIELQDNMSNLAFKFNIERPSCNRVKNLKF